MYGVGRQYVSIIAAGTPDEGRDVRLCMLQGMPKLLVEFGITLEDAFAFMLTHARS